MILEEGIFEKNESIILTSDKGRYGQVTATNAWNFNANVRTFNERNFDRVHISIFIRLGFQLLTVPV